jgi:hypothetical protein
MEEGMLGRWAQQISKCKQKNDNKIYKGARHGKQSYEDYEFEISPG